MPPKAADPAPNGESLRVLVIDDDRSHAETVAEVLERVGYDCTVVTSGRAGVQALTRDEYDVVLTDLRMNDLDGLAIVRKSRQEQPEAEVVVITGYADVKTAVEAIKQGAVHYLDPAFQKLRQAGRDDRFGVIRDSLELVTPRPRVSSQSFKPGQD